MVHLEQEDSPASLDCKVGTLETLCHVMISHGLWMKDEGLTNGGGCGFVPR